MSEVNEPEFKKNSIYRVVAYDHATVYDLKDTETRLIVVGRYLCDSDNNIFHIFTSCWYGEKSEGNEVFHLVLKGTVSYYEDLKVMTENRKRK